MEEGSWEKANPGPWNDSEITNSPNELRFIDYDTGKITTELSKLRP